MSLAASGSTDSVFYAYLFKIQSDNVVYNVCRYFEFGAFEGFNLVLKLKIQEKFNIQPLMYAAYTKSDVIEKKRRDTGRYQSRRKGCYFIYFICSFTLN